MMMMMMMMVVVMMVMVVVVMIVMMMKVVIIVIMMVMITNYGSNNDIYTCDGSGDNIGDDISNGDEVKCSGHGSSADGARHHL